MKIRIWLPIMLSILTAGLLGILLSSNASEIPETSMEQESSGKVPSEEPPFNGVTAKEASDMSAVSLRDWGAAPELSNEVWINTEEPLRLADLRGNVILLEMWTYGCYNCRNVIPSLKDWHARYSDQGLVIIGNHFPEFSYEKDLDNLKKAVAEQGILYPVAQDNDGHTWNAYNNRYWPTLYLIDKRGHIRYVHIGEGNYTETEAAIQSLLGETVQ